MKKMPIIHAIPRIAPTENGVIVGGSVNSLLTLLGCLDTPVRLYTQVERMHRENFANCALPIDDVVVRTNPYVPNTRRYGIYYLVSTFLRLVIHRRWAAVHGHSGFAPYALLTAALSMCFRRRPYYYTLYCPVEVSSRFARAVLRFGLMRHDVVFAMSANVAKSVVALGVPPDKVRCLPPHAPVSPFAQADPDPGDIKRSMGLPTDAPMVLFVGNLKASKGLDVLMRALPLVSADVSFVYTLEFVSPEEEVRLKELERGLGGARFKRLGFVENMPDLVSSADVVAVPFRDTQGPSDYPLIIMEAMAAGTPCVASSVGGIPELLADGRGGLLVERDNHIELARALSRLLGDDELRRRCSTTGAERAESFHPSRAARVVLDEY